MRLARTPGAAHRPSDGLSLLVAAMLAAVGGVGSGLRLARVIEMAGTLPDAGYTRLRMFLLAPPALLLCVSVLTWVAMLLALGGARRAALRLAWGGAALALAAAALRFAGGRPHALLAVACALAAPLLLDPRLPWRRVALRGRDALAVGAGVGLLLPLIWMLTASLRAPGTPQPTRLEWWPAAASLANYARLAELLPLGHYLRNSLLAAAIGVPASLIVASAAGFALVHLPPVWRRSVLVLSLLGVAVPAMGLWITRYLIFRWLGVLNSPLALLYPALLGGNPLCVLLLYSAFRRLPSELWDQARIDGAGPLRLWWQIGLPQVRGMLVALAALVFGLFWGNFTDPLLYLSDGTWQTLPVGLQSLQQLTRSDWPVMLAAAALTTAPAVAVFAAAQRALLYGDLRI